MSATSVGSSVRSTPPIASALFSASASRSASRVRRGVRQRVDRCALRIALAARQRVGMDRDEQCGLVVARDAHPLGQRNEGVVRARHDHAVFAALLDAVAQAPAQIQHQIFFGLACRGLGAVIDSAMARIDHDHGARVRPSAASCRASGTAPGESASCRRSSGPAADLANDPHEGRRGRRPQVRRPAGRLTVRGIEHVGFLDFRRSCEIDHHARAAGHNQTVAERLDQAAPASPAWAGKLETDLRNIDDDPIRIGEQEGAKIDLLVEIENKSGLFSSPASRTSVATGKSPATTGANGVRSRRHNAATPRASIAVRAQPAQSHDLLRHANESRCLRASSS